MPTCELCGREVEEAVDAIVEGAMLSVCKICSKFGHVIVVKKPEIVEEIPKKKIIVEETEELELIVSDFAERIKKARENFGLKQKQLASKIGEKESVIHKLESGHVRPSITLAKKLENSLKIKLIEKYKESKEKELDFRDGELTIGDLIKIKKKK